MESFRNKRSIVFVGVVSAFLLASCFAKWSGQAQNTQLPQPTGHVNDFAEVIDAPTKQRLETVLANLQQRAGIEFFIATVKGTGSEDIYGYSFRVADEWKLGPTSERKGIVLLIATESGKFYARVSGGAQSDLPNGLQGAMYRRMQSKVESGDYSQALLAGVEAFANLVGERNHFTFESLESPAENVIAQTRPRVVSSPAAEPTENPAPQPRDTSSPKPTENASPTPAANPTPLETPLPQPTETPSPKLAANPTPIETPSPQPTETPSPKLAANPTPTETPSPQPTETPVTNPTVTPTVTETPAQPSPSSTPKPSETPAVASPSPVASPQVTETPATEIKTPSPAESPSARPSPSDRNGATARASRPPAIPNVTFAPDDDELEKLDRQALILPPDKRIEFLKEFIAANPQSVALPHAAELMVVAHAMLGDQKLQANDVDAGLAQFRLAISEAPADMSDRLFTEVIARIPANLFFRGQRAPAYDFAHQVEALAKQNAKRLVAVAGFYLSVEDAGEAGRVAELAVQASPDSAAAHQALGAARHIALKLDEAESEYARALALDPNLLAAKSALADMRRGSGKFDEALTFYREILQVDARNNSARAGLVLSLLELGKKDEADRELNSSLQDKDQARNLPLLVGAAYWFLAHNNAERGRDLAQIAVAMEPRYAWSQIAWARAMLANGKALEAERGLRFARQFGQFPTIDYELASSLAAIGLYDEALTELARSFTLKDGQIETKLAGRVPARAGSFIELLAPERRAVIFQATPADTEANAKILKGLLAFSAALDLPEGRTPKEDDVLAAAQDFIAGDDAMRAFRQVYVAGKLLKKGIALQSVVELMDKAMTGVEAALTIPAATVAVQPEELSDIRARALAQGVTPEVPDAPRSALSGLLRGRIEDIAGMALFNLDQSSEAVARLRRAVSVLPQGTPLWRTALWHLGSALDANGKSDQALLYYIKSYVAGGHDAARRAIIENVYKKVNGTLDGLDDKIGPSPVTATAAPKPTPPPEAPAPTPEASPSPTPTATPSPTPTPTP